MNRLVLDQAISSHQALYDRLMGASAGHPNARYLAQMIASASAGFGAMPLSLGLSKAQFSAAAALHFPSANIGRVGLGEGPTLESFPELEDLRALLLEGRAGQGVAEEWIAGIVCAGCMSSDHLWSDLGLFSRAELSAMLTLNFPALAARNDRNMKWKKFFYKQLCAQEGIYVCRAPSCESCADYAKCFIDAED